MLDAERAQSTQIGFLLLFAALVIFFATYQAFVVPSQNKQVEISQNVETQAQFEELRNAIVAAPGRSNSQSVSIPLGTDYPSRVVALNPGPATGQLRTVDTTDTNVSVRIENARASGEVGDFWDGTTREYNTGGLEYRPNYNEYQQPPTTAYENSVVYNRFENENRPVTGQTLIRGRTINLVALNGSFSTTRAGAVVVEPRYVSASTNTVLLSGTGRGTGLVYEYYEADYSTEFEMPDFAASNLVRTGGVDNFDISERDRDSGFAFRFNGSLRVDDGGTYTFYTTSDDGSRLYVDGERVVNNDGQHSPTEQSGSKTLDAGDHNITVTYFEDDGQNVLDVEWAGPDTGGSRTAIADDRLSNEQGVGGEPVTVSVPTQLDNETWGQLLDDQLISNGGHVENYTVEGAAPYEYYEAEYDGVSTMPDFAASNLVRTGEIDTFDIKAIKQRPDDFAIRFNKRIDIPRSGEYTFYTTSDDGSRLYVDGERLVNNDGQHPNVTESSDPVSLDAGYHDITVTFFENDINDGLVVEWEGPSLAREEIPASALANREEQELTVELDQRTRYRLRTARVAVGTGVERQRPSYLVPVSARNVSVPESETRMVVLEVRDAHNNPVPNALVNVSAERGGFVDRAAETTATTNSQGRLELRYRSPRDIDGFPKLARLNASISRRPDPADFDPGTAVNASVSIQVLNADASGLGPGATPPYEIQWEDPTGQPGTTVPCDSGRCAFDADQTLTTTLTVNTTDPAVGVDVDYSLNDTSVGTVTQSGETDTGGEDAPTFEAEGTGTVGVIAASGGSVDTIAMVVSGIVDAVADDFDDDETVAENVNWSDGGGGKTVVRTDGETRSGASIGDVSNSGTRAVVLENTTGDNVLVTEDVSAADDSQLALSYAVKEGDAQDAPEASNEDLVVEYRDSGGTWVEIDRFDASGGSPYETRSQTLTTAAALHDAFRLRFRQPAADEPDPWYVDDLCIVESASDCSL